MGLAITWALPLRRCQRHVLHQENEGIQESFSKTFKEVLKRVRGRQAQCLSIWTHVPAAPPPSVFLLGHLEVKQAHCDEGPLHGSIISDSSICRLAGGPCLPTIREQAHQEDQKGATICTTTVASGHSLQIQSTLHLCTWGMTWEPHRYLGTGSNPGAPTS